ncbi:hypothetical protein Leryth_025007 [Lithospermum erythrorhizon]|nr:hypothetical protein Leryth_025007 [Lithospermum erythrorhizon]
MAILFMLIFGLSLTFCYSVLIGSEDGKLRIGYSSFRGKRATMEDFYDIKISKIDGKTVSLFGIFDGETFQQTDMGFLESERDTFRDDGSTASTAVLVGNHLYVANVGDSRAIIFKSGKGFRAVIAHFPIDAASLAAMEEDPEVAARKLTETAFTRGSADNITSIVVKFHHKPENLEGGDIKLKEESTNILHEPPYSETSADKDEQC